MIPPCVFVERSFPVVSSKLNASLAAVSSLATSWTRPSSGPQVLEGLGDDCAQAPESGFDPVALALHWTGCQSRMIFHAMTWWGWDALPIRCRSGPPSVNLSRRICPHFRRSTRHARSLDRYRGAAPACAPGSAPGDPRPPTSGSACSGTPCKPISAVRGGPAPNAACRNPRSPTRTNRPRERV